MDLHGEADFGYSIKIYSNLRNLTLKAIHLENAQAKLSFQSFIVKLTEWMPPLEILDLRQLDSYALNVVLTSTYRNTQFLKNGKILRFDLADAWRVDDDGNA